MFTNFRTKKLKSISLYFVYKKRSIRKLMFFVIVASIPGIFYQIFFFSIGTIYQILLAIITAFISEAIALYLRKLPIIVHLKDNSALLTALLLAISIPPLSPWWIIVLGTTFAILIAKHAYGGLGQNLFNPAMVGYVVLLISFPIQMTSWLNTIDLEYIQNNLLTSLKIILSDSTYTGFTTNQLMLNFDYVTYKIPLNTFETSLSAHLINNILQQPILKYSLTSISWKCVNIIYLFCGTIMLYYRIISWQIPFAFLGMLIFCSLLSWLIVPLEYDPPIIHLLSGTTMLGAFFIATDPVTAATTPIGRLIYGAIIGLLIWIIRVYGGYPDSVAFSVLLANIAVPLIDYYTKT
ncbi:MAG: electron transport complex subunit RsxD [Arsenophonus sp.]